VREKQASFVVVCVRAVRACDVEGFLRTQCGIRLLRVPSGLITLNFTNGCGLEPILLPTV
jgi:hypothetical protein